MLLYIIQLIDYNVEDEVTNNRLFILLAANIVFTLLKEEIDIVFIKDVFELKFLEYIGFNQ